MLNNHTIYHIQLNQRGWVRGPGQGVTEGDCEGSVISEARASRESATWKLRRSLLPARNHPLHPRADKILLRLHLTQSCLLQRESFSTTVLLNNNHLYIVSVIKEILPSNWRQERALLKSKPWRIRKLAFCVQNPSTEKRVAALTSAHCHLVGSGLNFMA